jgi:phosphoglycolate phosphatase-like HAD superfamily hydrolase
VVEADGGRAILFDIDGTLLSTGGASDRAWRRAFSELHGMEVNVGDYTGKGVTDPVVGLTSFRGAIGREPTAEEMAKLMALRLRYLPEEVDSSPGYRVLPGVEDTLARLTDEGRLCGLITGNVEAAAHIKLARAKLNHFFAFGGYGSDAPERVDVARKALERAELVSGGKLDRDRCLAVGDTPVDIEAAHGAGIRIAAVATGEYGSEALRNAGADHVLDTLRDPLPL